jgi:hypothetical protein
MGRCDSLHRKPLYGPCVSCSAPLLQDPATGRRGSLAGLGSLKLELKVHGLGPAAARGRARVPLRSRLPRRALGGWPGTPEPQARSLRAEPESTDHNSRPSDPDSDSELEL